MSFDHSSAVCVTLHSSNDRKHFVFIHIADGCFVVVEFNPNFEPDQVVKMREEFGVYIVGDSRINIAGLPADGLESIAKGLVSVEG